MLNNMFVEGAEGRSCVPHWDESPESIPIAMSGVKHIVGPLQAPSLSLAELYDGLHHQMGVSNGRSAVNDMSNVNASPKYHTITNADLEAINDLDKGLVR